MIRAIEHIPLFLFACISSLVAQDAAPEDRNEINTTAKPSSMETDSPVVFPKNGPVAAKFTPDLQAADYPAENEYYRFSSPNRSVRQIDAIQAEMPEGRFTPPPNDWKNLPRTSEALADGGKLHIVALGDSIINDIMRSGWIGKLAETYPAATVTADVYVRGGGGCQHYREENRIEKYLVPLAPDLVIIGGISQRGVESIAEVIGQIRTALPDCEFLLVTGLFGTADPRSEEAMKAAPHSGTGAYGEELAKLAATHNAAYLDATTPWIEYIRSSRKHPHIFYRDIVHANEYGEQIAGKIFLSFFLGAGE